MRLKPGSSLRRFASSREVVVPDHSGSPRLHNRLPDFLPHSNQRCQQPNGSPAPIRFGNLRYQYHTHNLRPEPKPFNDHEQPGILIQEILRQPPEPMRPKTINAKAGVFLELVASHSDSMARNPRQFGSPGTMTCQSPGSGGRVSKPLPYLLPGLRVLIEQGLNAKSEP